MSMKIKQTPAFKRDFKRLKRKNYDMTLVKTAVTALLSQDQLSLQTKYRDHFLKGDWQGYRELHIKGDWLLIYRIEADNLILILTRMGSHDEQFR